MIGIREAAVRLGVAESTIRRWIKDGILPHYQLGGRGGKIKFDEQELEDFKKRRFPMEPERERIFILEGNILSPDAILISPDGERFTPTPENLKAHRVQWIKL